MNRLVECPFCGGTDSVDNACQSARVNVVEFRSATGKPAYRVECSCGAHGCARLASPDAEYEWNKRVISPALATQAARIEELTLILEGRGRALSAAEARVTAAAAERDGLGSSLRNYAKLETMAEERAEAAEATIASRDDRIAVLERAQRDAAEVYDECANVAVPAKATAFEAIEAYRDTIGKLKARALGAGQPTLEAEAVKVTDAMVERAERAHSKSYADRWGDPEEYVSHTPQSRANAAIDMRAALEAALTPERIEELEHAREGGK